MLYDYIINDVFLSLMQGEVLPAKRPARKERVTPILALSVAAAVVGSSTQFGFNSGVINSPKQVCRNAFQLHAYLYGNRYIFVV